MSDNSVSFWIIHVSLQKSLYGIKEVKGSNGRPKTEHLDIV
ncbi:hypothetical protein VIBNIAM115_1820004 [Vibrio nigripulchritudo AM115]|nr:hypothetical protein VIBNIAM115_1820004 [Vibrio nigripulchritudo AM115]